MEKTKGRLFPLITSSVLFFQITSFPIFASAELKGKTDIQTVEKQSSLEQTKIPNQENNKAANEETLETDNQNVPEHPQTDKDSSNQSDELIQTPNTKEEENKEDSNQSEEKVQDETTTESDTSKENGTVTEKDNGTTVPESKPTSQIDKTTQTEQKTQSIATTMSLITYQGLALKEPTKIYATTSTTAKIIKTYSQGSILKYQSYSNDWYLATVYVGGKKQTGYIHRGDVENLNLSNQQTFKGYALQNPTRVYQKASTSSKTWKTYKQWSVLQYRSFSNNWYEATIYVNGNRKTGYIHKSHVQNVNISNQTEYKGIALQNPTRVYEGVTTGSSTLKSYGAGTILKYRSFSSNWYEATVYVNGKRKTGYINKSHVETATTKPSSLKGIGLQTKTAVYKQASTSSAKLKTYAAGRILTYKTFSNNWYEATVYINGEKTTGYIYKNHVDQLASNNGKSLHGLVKNSKANIYSEPSTNSTVLKSYKKFNPLKFKALSKNWYEATVYINGKARTGYLRVSDVSTDNVFQTSKNSLSFDEFVDLQMKANPKSDGAGVIAATREEVAYYANPANFPVGSPEYFQFLVLSGPANISVADINNQILTKDKAGNLAGQGEAFVKAANYHNINVVYLISHALHETGNGQSIFAKGIPVDKNGNVIRDKDGNIIFDAKEQKDPRYYKTIYNMFGYGATDHNTVNNGAKKAFDNGWFTVYDAIVGGSAQIAKNYINAGQNTLYKIRWNPELAELQKAAGHQYATHVQWATITAKRIYSVYSNLTDTVLAFDVPKFISEPSLNDAVFGTVTTSSGNLNIRKEPVTGSIIGKAPKDAKVEILTSKSGWYKISYNGTIGWVSSDYITISK